MYVLEIQMTEKATIQMSIPKYLKDWVDVMGDTTEFFNKTDVVIKALAWYKDEIDGKHARKQWYDNQPKRQ